MRVGRRFKFVAELSLAVSLILFCMAMLYRDYKSYRSNRHDTVARAAEMRQIKSDIHEIRGEAKELRSLCEKKDPEVYRKLELLHTWLRVVVHRKGDELPSHAEQWEKP